MIKSKLYIIGAILAPLFLIACKNERRIDFYEACEGFEKGMIVSDRVTNQKYIIVGIGTSNGFSRIADAVNVRVVDSKESRKIVTVTCMEIYR